MTDLPSLKERIGQAEGLPDEMRCIFKKLWAAFDLPPADRRRLNTLCKVDAFESAALTLVERLLPGWIWSLGEMRGQSEQRRYRAFLSNHNTPDGVSRQHIDANLPTPALALLSALLTALSKESEHVG
jgi:hypothetical protein